MAYIKAYTREIIDNRTYPSALAHSVHFSVSLDGANFMPLNQNYGILFPDGEVNDNNEIQERGILKPIIAPCEGGYIIYGDFVNPLCNEVYRRKAYAWTTADFVTFRDLHLIDKSELPKGTNTVAITNDELKNILDKWQPLECISVDYPAEVEATSIDELSNLTATCTYSDGSTDIKPIKLDLSKIDGAGEYTLSGEVTNPEFPRHCAEGLADPIVFKWDNKWYFLATNDKTNDVGMYVREADTVEECFAEGNIEKCILPYDESRNLIQTFWAPEFHVIGEDLYILFAVGGKQWAPQSHMMKLEKGGSIMNPDDWCDPIRVTKMDGTPLCTRGITLDMTYIPTPHAHYVAWSERYNCMAPGDSGSMIKIAEIDPANPTQLISEPVLITRPLQGWENQYGTINNEGPYPLIANGKVYLSYSGASAGCYSYAVGVLTADINADLLDVNSWTKAPTPLLNPFTHVEAEGPGHNGFYVGDDGKTMITYHAKPIGRDNHRCTCIHRVHFDKNGDPVFNMVPERDLPDHMKDITVKVIMK